MKKIKYGMVGGGQGAFIGGVHRIAARMDDHFELVAGAFSSTPEKSRDSAEELGVSSDRAYGDFTEMAKAEASRENGIEAVAIVTPNNMHFPVAKAFLEAGIHVICDKPMTTTIEDARELLKCVINCTNQDSARSATLTLSVFFVSPPLCVLSGIPRDRSRKHQSLCLEFERPVLITTLVHQHLAASNVLHLL